MHAQRQCFDVRLESNVMRFIRKPELLRKTGISYPTIWGMMRDGKFPRSRDAGEGSAAWIESEVDEWIATRPVRRLKGDPKPNEN